MTRTAFTPVRISIRRLLLPAAVAGALVMGAFPGTALATWTPDTVTDGFGLSRPAMRIDDNGKTGIAYERDGNDPGIFFATDATGSWVTTRVASGTLLTPDLAFDAADKAHIVYADLGSTPGIYEVTNATGSWVVTKLVDIGSPWAPSIAIDAGGKQHVAYSSVFSFEPGLYYLTDATGSWVNTRLTTGMYDQEPSLAIDGAGKLHIAFARYLAESRGIHLLTNATGSWVATRATTGYDDYPALVLDANDKDRIAFNRFSGTTGVYYTTDASGPWATEQVAGGNVGVPAVDIESNGVVHIVARLYTSDPMKDGLYHYFGPGGGGWAMQSDPFDTGEFPSVAVDEADSLRIAWGKPSGIVSYAPPNPGLIVDVARIDGDPSLAVDADGKDHVAFDRASGTAGGTMYGTNATGSWAIEGAFDFGLPPPELALDADGTAHMAFENQYATNGGGTWINTPLPTFGASQPALAVNPVGKAFVAYQVSDPVVSVDPGIHYATDFSGSWVDTRLTTNAADVGPDIALDGNNKAYIVYERASRIWYRTNRSGSWSAPVQITTRTSHDPVIALDPSGKVHVAFRGAAGVYEVNNVSGAWSLTRLSRSYADGAPSLGIDGSGKVYVLFEREGWAANPGIYLATNRSGSYTLGQVSSESDIGGMSLAILPGGLAHVLVDGPAGLMSFTQTDFLASANTSAASRASLVDTPVRGGQRGDSSRSGTGGPAGDLTGDDRNLTSTPRGTSGKTFTGVGGGGR